MQLTPDSGWIIKALWIAVALFFIYKIFRVRVRWDPSGNRPRGGPGGGPGGPGGGGWGGGGPGGGWGPGGGGDSSPPPPYSPHAKPDPATQPSGLGLGGRSYTATQQGDGGGGPGFWTGMAAGAAGAAAYNWATRQRDAGEQRENVGDYARWRAQRPAQRSWADYEPPSTRDSGPSDAGPSRRATGYGGSRTR